MPNRDVLLRQPTRAVGTVVRMTFDERGLARIVDTEDGMYEIEYLPDTARRSEYVRTGNREWAAPTDLETP